MKKHVFSRGLALLLCLSLVMGLVPGGLFGGMTEVNEVEQLTPIFSDGFENNLAQWTTSHAHVMYWIPDPGHNPYAGNRVLLMQDYATTLGHTITSNDIYVVPGETYTLTYQVMDHWAYVGSSIGCEVKLIFVDANGNVLETVTKPAASEEGANVAEWTAKTVEAVAPADAAVLHVEFNTVVEKKDIIYLVDALAVYSAESTEPEETEPEATEPEVTEPEVTEPEVTEPEVTEPEATEPVATEPVATEPVKPTAPDVSGYKEVINEQFAVEEGTEDFSTDWTASDNWEAKKYDVYIGGPYYEGGISVFLQGWKGIEDGWIQSPKFEVNAGLDVVALANTHTAAADCAVMKLIFVDAEGNVLSEVAENVGVDKTWPEEFVVATAPKGAVSAYLKFQRATADIGIDNVRVYAEQPEEPEVTEPEVTEPEATEPEATEPEATEPEATEPEATEPEATEPEATEPEDTPDDSNYKEVINEQFAVEEGDEAFSTDWTASDNWEAKKYDVYVGGPYYEEGNSVFLQGWKGINDGWIQSPAFAVNAGLNVVALANTFGAEGCANMMLIFVDAENNVLDTVTKAIGTADWTEEFVAAVAPAGAVSAYLKFQRATADIGIDNVRVYVEQPDYADSFENVTEDGKLADWGTSSLKGGNVSVVDTDKNGGKNAVQFVADAANGIAANTIKNTLEIAEGDRIKVTVASKLLSGEGDAYIALYFYDAEGNRVPEKTVYMKAIATSEEWAETTLAVDIPDGAATVEIRIGNAVKQTMTYLVDDVTVIFE